MSHNFGGTPSCLANDVPFSLWSTMHARIMPTTSFAIKTSAGAEQAWKYVRDYGNAIEWDTSVRTVEALEGGDAWEVTLERWPSVHMTYHRDEDTAPWDGTPRVVRFVATSPDGAVRTEELFTIRSEGDGAVVSYSIRLGMSGWRRLPCVGAAVWVHLRTETAKAQELLAKRLVAASPACEAV